jgi:succinate dehydrogenase/fumarate reductase flavoprotein subunit
LPDLVVAGAGMAGLCAAVRARELGAEVVVLEKGDRAGGSMLLSSGFAWRHRSFDDFRADCPDGDPELQRLVFDRFDEGIGWLESLGASVVTRDTGNPVTCGAGFEPAQLTEALVHAAGGDVRLREPLTELPRETPVVLATGGFQGDRDLLREYVTPEADHVLLRANRWSTGDGLRLGLGAGATTSAGMGEFYGRNMPAPPARVEERDYVRLSQLYARHALVSSAGETFATRTWSEIDVVQWTAHRPGATASYRVPAENLPAHVRERTVAEMVDAAEEAGAPVERDESGVTVEVRAAVTTTVGGLAIDTGARAADGVFAAGADAGGVMAGGYSSGLGAALVLGRIAAESALA